MVKDKLLLNYSNSDEDTGGHGRGSSSAHENYSYNLNYDGIGIGYRENDSRSLSLQSEVEEQEQIRLVESPDLDPKMNFYPEIDRSMTPPPTSSGHSKKITIDRPVINQMMLYSKYGSSSSESVTRSYFNCCWNYCHTKCKIDPIRCITSLFPILSWLPNYEWKNDLTYDLFAGFTMAVMQIPQGMAYALLGNLPPIVGIYMAFFPVIVYVFMGTSRHVSMGTFAVICLMTGKVIMERMAQYTDTEAMRVVSLTTNNVTLEEDIETNFDDDISKAKIMELATAISLSVGFWQVLMGFLRLGALSLLLSTELVSGFTTGAAIHVLTSQIKTLFGLHIPRRNGIFKIILTYVDMIQDIQHANHTAIILSGVTIAVLIIYNEIIKPYLSKKIPFPLPVELLIIIVGTLISWQWNFESAYGISVVSTIPTGLPEPKLPPLNIVYDVMLDGLIISVVAYAISISMCKIFATKHNYEVDANQELIAQGTSNIIGSLFSCAPIAVSLSRSVILDAVGGKTQLVGLFSSGILIFVLLWIGPIFETLPNCMLAAIIVVALKGMFLQFSDLPKAWKVSFVDASVWLLTFLATVILDIEYGLAVGIFLSLLTLTLRSNKGSLAVLGNYSNLDLYVDLKSNSQAKEIPSIKILKYTGTLNFTTVESMVHRVQKIINKEQKLYAVDNQCEVYRNDMLVAAISDNNAKSSLPRVGINIDNPIQWLILDLSSVSSIDPEAVKALYNLYNRYAKQDIQILFAGCPPPILNVMNECSFLRDAGYMNFYPSVHDAVISTKLLP